MARPDDHRPIVAGVDPDPAKRWALAWAADEAALRRVPLRLVHAETLPTAGIRRWEPPPSWEACARALREAGEQVLKAAVSFVEARQPGIEVSGLPAEGDPAWVLREQGHDAAAVVLGSWHLSRVRDVFSASVVLNVMAHARCPVVVVPEPQDTVHQDAYVVVGVDGSARSAAAVDVAFQEAALRGAGLRALYVWQPGLLGVLDEHAARQDCRRLLHETVADRGAAYPDVALHQELVGGHPVKVLTEASAHALGLVVGTRGHGGFTGMLLGSVSQGVLHHTHCPVIVVPHDLHA
ncbi:universal stress protein [Streptomyces sp. NPDC003753]|uniref:universal stress protein n=1 Tax=Streptomyces sp. Y2F8-2 TaxID=2759675 RepID=UPI0019069EE4|nr:universal stress protein [Streptomyces sp. Y2F8-2]GHK04989.1 universal stress protein [Streptomyces sp. Y2F8-2]